MLAERPGFLSRFRRKREPIVVVRRVDFYTFQAPHGYPLIEWTAIGMVGSLHRERAFCVSERKKGRGCPPPFATWDEVLARLDRAIAELEGLD